MLRLFELAANQAAMQPMEFRFAHRAPESQEQSIIVLSRVVNAVFINDEGLGEGTDLNEAIPIATRTSQA
jgi:hypothetical protein